MYPTLKIIVDEPVYISEFIFYGLRPLYRSLTMDSHLTNKKSEIKKLISIFHFGS